MKANSSDVTVKNNQSVNDCARRLRIGSEDSSSTLESSFDVSTRDSSSKSISRLENISDSASPKAKFVDVASYETADSPYLSALNLPVIMEEDSEYDAYNTLTVRDTIFDLAEEDDSPFILKSHTAKFEDSCENSDLMSSLWRGICLQK
mmetsp:Transcript_26980/g.31143  ORF Transcript_26980/g.31143 Transcript_26980/m.31143 type:complete len:149 (-) Transcript_26980:61-507(-)